MTRLLLVFKLKLELFELALQCVFQPRGYGDDRYLIGLRGLIALRSTKIKTKKVHEKFHQIPVVITKLDITAYNARKFIKSGHTTSWTSGKKGPIDAPTSERIMIYVKQESEEAFTALHLKPPTIQGLISALESKYKINGRSIRHLHRVNRFQHKVKIDDEMITHYTNESAFYMQVRFF